MSVGLPDAGPDAPLLGMVIGEIAHYRSWIAWVPILAPLFATALVFRRVHAFSLGILGGVVGLAAVSVVSMFGWVEEPTTLLLGMGVGVALGIAVGISIDDAKRRDSRWVRDRSVVAIAPAITLGVVGLIVGGFIPALLQGSPPDMDPDVLVAAALGGGIGWCAGAVIGWQRAGEAVRPSVTQRRSLYAMAFTFAFLGIVVAIVIRNGAGGPSFDSVRDDDPRLRSAAALVCVDTALSVATVRAVAKRRQPQLGLRSG
jgi:hypothetical protein